MGFKNWLTRNIFIISIVAGVLLILIIFLGVDISRRARNISDMREDLSARLSIIKSLSSLKIDAEAAAKLRDDLEKMLPAKDRLIVFSKELENIAKKNQLSFKFSFEEELAAKETAPGINGFTAALEGSYANFINFLNAAEKSDYFISWEYIELAESGGDYNAIIKGKVFSQ